MQSVRFMSDCIVLKSREFTQASGSAPGLVRTVEVRWSERRLIRDGVHLPRMTPQETKVLRVLVEAGSEVVGSKILASQLWPANPPADPAHRVRDIVMRLRERLGDSPNEAYWIETVPGAGYRFVGSIMVPAKPPATEVFPAILCPPPVVVSESRDTVAVQNELPSRRIIPAVVRRALCYPVGTWNVGAVAILLIAALACVWFTPAYGFAVLAVCLAATLTLAAYAQSAQTPFARFCTAVILLGALAYLPSALTLLPLEDTVVNLDTLRPAIVYPFITGLKFLPEFVLIFGFWVLLAFFGDAGFRAARGLGWAYVIVGAVFLAATSLGIAGGSGDYRLWHDNVPGRKGLALAYLMVLAVNIAVWVQGFRFFRNQLIPSYRRLFGYCGVAYALLAPIAFYIDWQYNRINQRYLDKRRPEVYRVANPDALQTLLFAPPESFKGKVGPRLAALLRDPDFVRVLRTEQFYKQDFDEPFQLLDRAVMFGYKLNPRGAGEKPVFRIVRWPKDLANALRFEVATSRDEREMDPEK